MNTADGIPLDGYKIIPPDFDETKKYPTVVFSGPFNQVKEQMGAVYGKKMAAKGYVFLYSLGNTAKFYVNDYQFEFKSGDVLIFDCSKSALKKFLEGRFKEHVKDWSNDRAWLNGKPSGKLYQVVLADYQTEHIPALEEVGFKIVNKFDNSTGTKCTVLHYITPGAER